MKHHNVVAHAPSSQLSTRSSSFFCAFFLHFYGAIFFGTPNIILFVPLSSCLPFLYSHYSFLPLSTFENAGFNWAWHSFTPLGKQKRDGDIILRHEISNTMIMREKNEDEKEIKRFVKPNMVDIIKHKILLHWSFYITWRIPFKCLLASL